MRTVQQLGELRSALRENMERINALGAGGDDAAWTKRPPSGGWSAAECVAHLTRSTEVYMPLLNAARAAAPRDAALPRRFDRGFGAWLLETFLEPPYRMRSKTLPSFEPGAVASKSETLAQFDRGQRELIKWIDDAAGAPLHLMKIASPFNEKMSYNAYGCLRVLVAHQRRHIWQAERALSGVP